MRISHHRLSKPIRILLCLLLLVPPGIVCYQLFSSVRRLAWRHDLTGRLIAAVEAGDVKTVQMLLDQGANLNWAVGRSFLFTAMERNDKPMIALLLKRGADPSLALYEAYDVNEAEALLRLGANVNPRVSRNVKETPLMTQASQAHVEIVRFLLAHGAEVAVKDDQGRTLLERVRFIANDHPEMATEYRAIIQLLKQAGTKE